MASAGKERSAPEKEGGARASLVLPSDPSLAPRSAMPSIRARRDAGSGDGIERELRGDDIEERSMGGDEVSEASGGDNGGSVGRFERESEVGDSGSDGRSPDYSETIERSQRRPRSVVERLTPFCCHRDGTIEELPDLAPELDRSAEIGDQDWGVGPTLSDYESLSSLMQDVRASGVTFWVIQTLSPRDAERSTEDRRASSSRVEELRPEKDPPAARMHRKRLKLPIAGMSSTVYPDYAGILAAQLGDTRFGPTVIASGANSADVSALIDREPALVSATAGLEAEGAVDVPPPRKRRKKTKSATKPRADPPLDGDDGDGARSPRMRRGDDGIDGDREGVRMESSASPAGGLSSGGGAPGSSRTTDGALATLEVSDLSLPDRLAALARAEAEAATCKNMLLTGYEAALRKAVLDLEKAKEKIRVKEAEIETFKKEKLDEVNELEIARNRISQLEKEKVEDSEKTKRAMERLRQSRSRELLSERNCVAAAAERRFEKFRKYMADRDRKEEKRLLHGTALGTLDAVNLLEKKGLPVPRELKDLLVANEAKFGKEAEEVTVEVISAHDLALSPPRSASAVAPRSPSFGNVAPLVAQVATVARQPTTILSGDRAGALDRPFGTVSGPFGTVSGPSNRDDSSEGQET
ncbi:hypothetical protein Bca4012_020596 [Brassica carinata]